MTIDKKPRVMWLLNHGTARKFDVAMLKQVGIEEIFLSKQYPLDIKFRSGSVDYSEDATLTIAPNELAILNNQDWYGTPTLEAWDIANRYFDIIFFIAYDGNIINNLSKNFKGIVLWRAFGLDLSLTYSKRVHSFNNGISKIKSFGNRLYFAEAYDHLHEREEDFLQNRALFLPVGLHDACPHDIWQGINKKIFLVCPSIAINSYYQDIYEKFIQDFKGLEYAIGGEQPSTGFDPNVLGFVSQAEHEKNMCEMRVMFYQGQEPYHIHYHPFEAIRAGMPLVFMAGGMLDRFGGRNLPGRCTSIREARKKIERILNDDWTLIEEIRRSQICLLEPMKPENCIEAWRSGFEIILKTLQITKKNQNSLAQVLPIKRKKRIAVILADAYKGGTLRGAKLFASALLEGACQAGEGVEVVFAHRDCPLYDDNDFFDLPSCIKRRPYLWLILNRTEAERALLYAGIAQNLNSETYGVFDDSINQFMDCDLLVVISDRLIEPFLPLKPYVMVVYDYLQRYEDFLSTSEKNSYFAAVHAAERVLVTSDFTYNDALQFAGLTDDKVIKLPHLFSPFFKNPLTAANTSARPYFLWTTNSALHKNHAKAFRALFLYYEKYNGRLDCHVTGSNSNKLLEINVPYLASLSSIVSSSKLEKHLKLFGDLPDTLYQSKLKSCQFLWHAGRIDNGTFSVIEAAWFGIPSLSSNYPAMREIDKQFSLNLNWMDPYDPEDMAIQLKKMEVERESLQMRVPSAEVLATQSIENLAGSYWKVVRECL